MMRPSFWACFFLANNRIVFALVMGVFVLTNKGAKDNPMFKVLHVLPLVAFVVFTAGCTLPAAQPFAAMSADMPQIAPQSPTTNATKQPTEQTAQPYKSACIVTAQKSLNLRSAPGTFAPVLVVLSHGDALTVIDDRGAWWHVSTGANVTGYINSIYCKLQQG